MREWIFFVASLVLSGTVAYAAAQPRLSVLETKQITNDYRLERIESKIDLLVERLLVIPREAR